MPLSPGDSLERYVIEGILGQGGMGIVYRARDTRLNRSVALKVLHEGPSREAGTTTGGSSRILREARTAAMLEHPNVVAMYDVGEIAHGSHAGTPYLAMELVEGRSLRGYVGDVSIPLITRVRWLADVARGLHAAHERALVHRDMKPENVIVRTDGVVKVLDFGIAKQQFVPVESASGAAIELRTLTGEGAVLGTPLYMAPEQMRGSHVDAKADQFAWGVVAYELLTGQSPWGTKQDAIQLVAAVLSNEPADPRTLSPEIPAWLAQVILRALAKSPDDRYPSMRAVADALNAGEVATAPTQLAAAGSVADERETRRPPRSRWALGAAIGAMGVVAIAAMVRARVEAPDRSTGANGAAATGASSEAALAPCDPIACTKELGKPSLCRPSDHACVAIASIDCRPLADEGALASADTLWLGALYSTSGKNADWGKESERGAELAREDFARTTGVLRAGSRRARPIGLVSCDDAVDAHRAARHLVEDLGVPAVIDSQGSAALVSLVASELAPHGAIDVATTAASPMVTEVPRAAGAMPLVWRTSNNATENALALAKLVEAELEPRLRAAGVAHTRVAVVRPNDPSNQAMSERFFGALRFNGMTALDNGGDYREIVLDPDVIADAGGVATADVAQIRAFAPGVVLAMDATVYGAVVQSLERTWPRGVPRPYYLGPSLYDDGTIAMVGRDRSFRHRVFGVGATATTSVNALFTMHYNEAFKTDLSRVAVPSTDYDAFYVLAYASFALGDDPPTGQNLAKGITRLIPNGPTIDVGPSGIFAAFSRLNAGESIDLNGAGGNLDFDEATGEHQADLAIMCLGVDGNGVAHDNVESGLVYRARSGRLEGHARCP